MRVLLGIAAGITLSILAYALWQPAIEWTLMHNEPETDPACHPRFRSWHKGVMTEGPW